MKKLYLILLTLLPVVFAWSQPYGNEWIDYSQKFYGFKIAQNGLYKIDYATLNSNGIPVSTLNSSSFQIFGKDKEVPVYMVDNGDNSFDSGDYFLFYAYRNDGWLDSIMYPNPAQMANPGYSLINDTITYFFSWKNSGTGLRFALQPDQNYSNYTPSNFVRSEYRSNYSEAYCEGVVVDEASGSIYSRGEGYGLTELASTSTNVSSNIAIPTPNVYTGAGGLPVKLECRLSSNSMGRDLNNQNSIPPLNHHTKLTFGASNLPIIDTTYGNYYQVKTIKNFQATDLTNGTTNIHHEIIMDLNITVDRQIFTYAVLSYPRLPIGNNQPFDRFFVQNGAVKSRIDLSNFSGSAPLILSFGSVPRYEIPTVNAGLIQFIIPNNPSGIETEVLVVDINTATSINSLTPVNGTGVFTDFSTLNSDSALIFVYHPSLASSKDSYLSYRSSLSGGGHNVLQANIEELYLQFAGGIIKHPLAIRRFVHFIHNTSTQKPEGLLLIGKGLSIGETRSSPSSFVNCLIPPMGYPASDIATTAGLISVNAWEPLLPTGRLSMTSNTEVENYLSKIEQYEDAQSNPGLNFAETKNWQKQLLHFVGGSDALQQNQFQGYMNQMKAIVEDTVFAGNVTNYFKSSSNPLDPNVVTTVTQKIEDGVSIMNFFGHAAASNNGFEINIDEPSNWNNFGKYPIVIGNSCYNGNIFKSGNSTSENFVNIPNEGAIAFLSTISVGYDSPLAIYSTELYKQFSYKNYGKTFGSQIKSTIKTIYDQYTPVLGDGLVFYESACTQMTLHGDPMLKVNYSTAPEIDIQVADLSLSPNNVNLSVDSVELTFTIRNIGKSIKTPVYIEIRRNFPGTATDSLKTLFLPRLNYDTIIKRKFPLQAEISAGVNNFTVSIDIPNVYQEQFEEISNNQASANFFLNIDGMLPIWPYNYAVIPYDTITVKASTINPIAEMRTYLFELDTTDTYNSPQLRRFSVTGLGGVKSVHPNQWLSAFGSPFPLTCTDSTVYFWRVAADSTVPNWSEYSFQYIPGKRGWGQDHFFQFKNNSFSGLIYDRNTRTREFILNDYHTIGIQVMKTTNPDESVYNGWTIDNSLVDYATCSYNPYIYVAVVNSSTLEPWKTHCPGCASGNPAGSNNDPSMNFGNLNNLGSAGGQGCRDRFEYYFTFDETSATSMANFQNMIENGIPDSSYVIIYSPFTTYFDSWTIISPGIYTMFQNLGFPSVNPSQPNDPFALFFKKGTTSFNQVKFWTDNQVTNEAPVGVAKINILANVLKPAYLGVEKTPQIGPAFEWETLYWRRDSLESPSTDSVRIFIEKYGITNDLLGVIDTAFTPLDSIINLNNLVDAAIYPRIRIGIYNSDKANLTPAQIDRIHVLYQPVPEAAIDGSSGYYASVSGDTLYEGQDFSFAVDVVNVSEFDMDSLLVDYWIEDQQHIKHVIPYPRQDSLRIHQILRDTIQFNSIGRAGYNILWMEINPYVNGSLVQTDQLEQYHYNNILQLPVFVVEDNKNPILDVTFNGQHILNGDIIDPTSEILITLKDDNPYLVMDNISDTTLFGIYLTGPDGIQKRIPFIDANGNTIMQWYPATGSNLKFKIVYPKEFLSDGMYQLFVQGTDRSGNISGDYEYKATFEVIRESSITQMMNYPNPFSTSTRFVFTLTGTEVPDDIIIQIMTVSGRVIREITEDELGLIRIGRNITDYAWDGKDEFGDPLANGVYLYQVKAKIQGEDIKHRDSGADQYFKKNFGKMYLMR
ncbi:C25 family cysteine peptidase [Fluviicola sp.]|uniref:putative type IX secretion system sortase PorU2 n=1 Tax=Fluviicola sp. TaxID=1917219 RepID=UPI003D28724A